MTEQTRLRRFVTDIHLPYRCSPVEGWLRFIKSYCCSSALFRMLMFPWGDATRLGRLLVWGDRPGPFSPPGTFSSILCCLIYPFSEGLKRPGNSFREAVLLRLCLVTSPSPVCIMIPVSYGLDFSFFFFFFLLIHDPLQHCSAPLGPPNLVEEIPPLEMSSSGTNVNHYPRYGTVSSLCTFVRCHLPTLQAIPIPSVSIFSPPARFSLLVSQISCSPLCSYLFSPLPVLP
jgi:hypothetical protein